MQKETANIACFLYFIFPKLFTTLEALERISNGDDSDFDFSYSSHKVFIDFSEAQNVTTKVSVNNFSRIFVSKTNGNEKPKAIFYLEEIVENAHVINYVHIKFLM